MADSLDEGERLERAAGVDSIPAARAKIESGTGVRQIMRTAEQLPARHEQILCSIVNSYIETGEPVPSSDISRRTRSRLSAATVRGVMAELAAQGYLHQPHASAGRVPTEKAFRTYVGTLPGHRVLRAELGRIRETLATAGSVEGRVGRCAQVLTEMTGIAAITAAVPTATQTLDQVELLPMGDRRVHMIVVTRDRLVRNRIVTIDEPIGQDELASVRNYINQHFGGWVISDIREELRARLAQASEACDLMQRRLIGLYEKGLLDVGLEPEVHMEGTANLVDAGTATRQRLKELLAALDEKKLVLELLERFLEHRDGQVAVCIGLSDSHPSLGDLSLIGVEVAMAGGTSARLAVLGPMRMNYPRVMSAVLHVGRAFSSLPS